MCFSRDKELTENTDLLLPESPVYTHYTIKRIKCFIRFFNSLTSLKQIILLNIYTHLKDY